MFIGHGHSLMSAISYTTYSDRGEVDGLERFDCLCVAGDICIRRLSGNSLLTGI